MNDQRALSYNILNQKIVNFFRIENERRRKARADADRSEVVVMKSIIALVFVIAKGLGSR